MAMNFTRVGTEVQINNTTPEGQQIDADVALGTDGRFLVAFERQSDFTDTDIRLQFMNPDGTHSGGIVLVESGSGAQVDPVVASRPGGGAVVVWADVDGSLTDGIELRVVGSDGALSPVLTVADSTTRTFSAPDAAMLANGEVVVVFESFSGSGVDIEMRVLNAAGTGFTGASFFVEASADELGENPAIAASGNNALIVYGESATDGIFARFFNGATGAISPSATALGNVASGIGDLEQPDVAALTDGRYVVVWQNGSNDDIEGRFIDANGNPIGSVFTIANLAGSNTDPRVAALPDGGFIVTWDNNGAAIPPEEDMSTGVVARRFDAAGAPSGDLFLVSTDPDGSQDDSAIAVNPATGQAFIAWEDNNFFPGTGQDNDPPGIRGRAFVTTTDPVAGSAANDSITTYNLAEQISGLEGNDTINAMGGNDLVDGGLGNDSLTGGLGADSFLFNTAIKPKGSNIDTIADFSVIDDTILLDNAIFTKLKKDGALKGKYFEVGKKADDKDDYIVYNKKTGDLSYDKNGDHKGGAVLFAVLEGSPNDISKADFFVV